MLCCFVTPDLGEDVQRHNDHILCVCNHQTDIKPKIKLVVSLVIADGHFNFP